MSGLVNWYEQMPEKYQEPLVHMTIPMRCALLGNTGSGKSNTLLNMIMALNRWSVIVMAVKCPEESLYQSVIATIREIEKKLSTPTHTVNILTVVTEIDEIPPLESFDDTKQSLVIFDDMIGEKEAKLKHIYDFWIRGRRQGVSTIFLSRSYFSIPKLIRKNLTCICFKEVGTNRELKAILSEYTQLHKTVNDLKDMYVQCHTADITSCFMIDLSAGLKSKWTYRCNFTPLSHGNDEKK
jgi:hypothetical protein